MEEKLIFTKAERTETLELLQQLRVLLATSLQEGDEEKMLSYARKALKSNVIQRDVFGLNPIHQSLKTAILAVEEEGLKRDGVLAILLYNSVISGVVTLEEIDATFGGQASSTDWCVYRTFTRRIPSSRARTSGTCCSRLPKTCA